MSQLLARVVRIVAGCVVVLAFALPVAAADQIFVQMPTIPGDSTDAAHTGWIDAFALTEGVRAGPITWEDVSFLKGVDRASPLLHTALAAGSGTGTVLIDVCRTTGGCYYRITLETTLVRSVSGSGSSCVDPTTCNPTMTESVTLTFNRIRWRYTPPTGPSIERCWDRGTNSAC